MTLAIRVALPSNNGGSGSSSVSSRGGLPGTAGIDPVLTMMTVQRALCEMRFGTLSSKNCVRPCIPALPTTRTSAPASSAVLTMTFAASSSTNTLALPRTPASSEAMRESSDAALRARVPAAAPASVVPRAPVGSTWMISSSAPMLIANAAAHCTARSAVSDRSVATATRRMLPTSASDRVPLGTGPGDRIVMS